MREMPYVIAAYSVAWVTFVGLVVYLAVRARRAESSARSRATEG